MAVGGIRLVHRNGKVMYSYEVSKGDNLSGTYPDWLGNGHTVWGQNNDLYFKVMKPTQLTQTKQHLNIFGQGTIKGVAYNGKFLGVISQRVGFPFSNMDFRLVDLNGNVLMSQTSITTNNWTGLTYDGKYYYTIDTSNSNITQLLLQGSTIRTVQTYSLSGSSEQDLTYDGKYFYVVDRSGSGSPPSGNRVQILLDYGSVTSVTRKVEIITDSGMKGICFDGNHFIMTFS